MLNCCEVTLSMNSHINVDCDHMLNLLYGPYTMTSLQGYNGSQLWDTAFAVQAIISTNLFEEYGPTLEKAHMYIKKSQVISFSLFIGIYMLRDS
jgi:cycloartenol synthase